MLKRLCLSTVLTLAVFAEPVIAQNCAGWDQVGLAGRIGHAMAYDSLRHVTVMFGGHDGDFDGQTWEFDGSAWERKSSQGPSPRNAHAMAFDSLRGVTVLFGGNSDAGASGETWEWDGLSWTLRSNSGPSPRYGHSMVFDSVRGLTYLFGGRRFNPSAVDDTTWAWDGAQWTQVAVSGPPARAFAGMAFDVERGVTVLFGGSSTPSGGPYLNDTWEWDGASWQLRATGGPAARSFPAMADDAGNRMLMFGGLGDGSFNLLHDTWAWNGTAWFLQANTGPSARYAAAMVHDVDHKNNVLFSGYAYPYLPGDTWTWTGDKWVPRDSGPPTIRIRSAMAFDSARNVMVLFGGSIPNLGGPISVVNGETWEWDGAAWSRRSVRGPTPRKYHSMSFDSHRNVTVLFGGSDDSSTPNSETWEWDGTSWTLRTTAGPTARSGQSMCFDAQRQVTVLFGGAGAGGYSPETWKWDGAAWSLRSIAGPLPRVLSAMVYDQSRGRNVLFGGRDFDGQLFHDTWEWDGGQWTLQSESGPPGRYEHMLGYDAVRGRVIVFGGWGSFVGAGDLLRDVWSWNGSHWSFIADAPRYRTAGVMAYDGARHAIVMHAGSNGNVYKSDTWTFNLVGPEITQHPVEQIHAPGETAQFTVQATGTGQLQYQWFRNGVLLGNGGNISGAQSSMLTISNVTGADAGLYDVVVSDRVCSVMSDIVSLVVVQQCLADIAPPNGGNGAVDIDDLVQVINHWGPCPATCPGDVNHSGSVNIDDLVAVITAWGACR